VYSTSAGPGVRHKCIQAKLRMILHASPGLLREVLPVSTVSSQVAGMLSSGDLKIIIGALQISEILLQKMPEEFSVHFRREGVLHQAQKLSDPEDPLLPTMAAAAGNTEPTASSVAGASAIWTPSRSAWSSIPGPSSCPNVVYTDQLRVPKRREESSPDIAPSIRLSDMLKRKRVSKRPSLSRKGRHSEPSSAEPSTSRQSTTSWSTTEFTGDGSSSSSNNTPSRRSRFADKTSSLFSQLHPARWGRSPGASSDGRKDGSSSSSSSHLLKSPPSQSSTPATLAHGREKAQRWVRERASTFLESYFKESLGSRHPALTILRRLSVQVDHLSKKPKDGERSLKEIFSILQENDISPFEVSQSGLVPSLLKYLKTEEEETTAREISHEVRIRTFLSVFLGTPKSSPQEDQEDSLLLLPDPELISRARKFISKLNACLNHLEQFPIKMHDMTSGSSGVKSAGSTLRFFKTHHLKCNLQRHPSCSNLKSWKGGLVKIDPLALVQAIERYLISRGYGTASGDKDSGGSEEEDDDDDEMSDEEEEDGGHNNDDTLPSTSRGSTGGGTSSGGGGGGTSNSSSSSSDHRLEFLIGEHVLPYEMTVYQSIQQFGSIQPKMELSGLCGSPSIWARIHTIYYRPAAEEKQAEASSGKQKGDTIVVVVLVPAAVLARALRDSEINLWTEGIPPVHRSPLYTLLGDKLPKITSDPSSEVLCLLRVLHILNRYWWTLYPNNNSGGSGGGASLIEPSHSPVDFLNPKLSAKVNRQLQDPIIIMTSNLPPWLKDIARLCPFLFPFETRQLLFYVTSFDRDRALLRLLDSIPELGASDAGQERVTPDLDRKKRVISREDNLLKQSEQVMNELGSSRSLLEIQYENEFYTLVSKELQKLNLGSGRGKPKMGTHAPRHVQSMSIPAVASTRSSQRNKIKNKFHFLGKFIAKAVLDNRMIDIPFSQPFYQWLLRQESTLGLPDLRNVDPAIASTINSLEGIARKETKTGNGSKHQIKSLTMDGCPIQDLGLDFTLPGYPHIELRKGGKDIPVSIDNLSQYVGLVIHWLLIEGIGFQMESLREGFESVFPLSNLSMFYPEELEQIFCGSGPAGQPKSWDLKTLAESTKPDHGFNSESPAFKSLLEVMSSYNHEEQRQFLQFALNPPLTIVKKSFDSPHADPDDYLPSVMTCVNYLKLPDYS
ncbi:Thyroid hormone receptor interactor 12, partial [Caligus rogercresseyi]